MDMIGEVHVQYPLWNLRADVMMSEGDRARAHRGFQDAMLLDAAFWARRRGGNIYHAARVRARALSRGIGFAEA